MTGGSQWFRDTPADRRKRVAALHAKGIPNSIIAKRLGIADTTVSQDLLVLGLRTKTSQGQAKSARLAGPGTGDEALSGGGQEPGRDAAPVPAPRPLLSLADVYALQAGVDVEELLTPHALAKLDLINLQALFLDGLTAAQRGRMTGRTAAFTFAEMGREQLVAAVLRQHEKTAAPGHPRTPGAVCAPATPPVGGALAGAGGLPATAARPAPGDLGAGGAGKDTGDAARPGPARRAS